MGYTLPISDTFASGLHTVQGTVRNKNVLIADYEITLTLIGIELPTVDHFRSTKL
jgi:hypothetical protein